LFLFFQQVVTTEEAREDNSGAVIVNKDQTVTVKILAKPGAKQNAITGNNVIELNRDTMYYEKNYISNVYKHFHEIIFSLQLLPKSTFHISYIYILI